MLSKATDTLAASANQKKRVLTRQKIVNSTWSCHKYAFLKFLASRHQPKEGKGRGKERKKRR